MWDQIYNPLGNAALSTIAAKPTADDAMFGFYYLSFAATGVLIASNISGFLMASPPTLPAASWAR